MRTHPEIFQKVIVTFISLSLLCIVPANFISSAPSEWRDDIRLTFDASDSYYSDIISDEFDIIHVAWRDDRETEGTGGIYYKKLINSTWTEDLLLNPNENWGYKPAMELDNNHNLHVVWYSNSTIPNALDISHKTFSGTSWSDSEVVAQGASFPRYDHSFSELDIVVDSNNWLYVFWSADRNPVEAPQADYHEVSYVYYDGLQWSQISNVTDALRDHVFNSVAMDSNDNIHLVYTDWWMGGMGSDYWDLFYQKLNESEWSAPSLLFPTNRSSAADLMIDSQDNIHLTWALIDNMFDIYYAKLDNNGSIIIDMKQITFFSDDPGPGWQGVYRKSSEMDSKGNIHVIWHNLEDQDFSHFPMKYVRIDGIGEILEDVTDLSISTLHDDNGYGWATNKHFFTLDSANRIHMVFSDDRDGNNETYYRTTLAYDLGVVQDDLQFSDPLPQNGQSIQINATIHNHGDALTSATVNFYLDQINPGNLIESKGISIPFNGTQIAAFQWNAVSGSHTIWVEIDSEKGDSEFNLTNNIANKSIMVNDPPTIIVTEPKSGQFIVDTDFTISWVGNDPDEDARIELFYDTDDSGYDGTLIDTTDQYPSGIYDNNGIPQSYKWNTSAFSDNSIYYIYAKIYDPFHNPAFSYGVGFILIDHPNEFPTVNITSPLGGTVSGSISIQGTSQVEDGTISLVEVQIENTGWYAATGTTTWSIEWDTTVFPNGVYEIHARAKDDSDHYSDEDTVTLLVDNGGPNFLPVVLIESHSDNEMVTGSVQIAGSSQDQDGIVESVEVKIDDGNWNLATGTSSWTYVWETESETNGEYQVFVRAKDNSGEYSQEEMITLIVNNGGNVPPVITISSPLDEKVSGTQEISGFASDVNGNDTISSVEINVDDVWEAAEGTFDWSYLWDTTEFEDGDYTIIARAFDGTDYSLEKSITLIVDNPHKPVLTITSDTSGDLSGTLTISGMASDEDGDITKVEIQIDDGEWIEVTGTTDWSYELDTTKLSDGEHTINIRVYDDEAELTQESLSINVQNSNWTSWLWLIIILVVLVLVFVGLMSRRRKAKPEVVTVEEEEVEVLPQTTTETPNQGPTQTIKCPQCNNLFEIPESATTVQCPHCGTKGTL
jgi:hypothetical protein